MRLKLEPEIFVLRLVRPLHWIAPTRLRYEEVAEAQVQSPVDSSAPRGSQPWRYRRHHSECGRDPARGALGRTRRPRHPGVRALRSAKSHSPLKVPRACLPIDESAGCLRAEMVRDDESSDDPS